MFLTFDKMPSYSRLWLYQSDRELTDTEVSTISAMLLNFLESWETHGSSLIASFEIRHNRFIILAVNEELTKPSGCSIDKSISIIKTIEEKFKISLFDRTKIAYFDTTNQIQVVPLLKIKELVINQELTPDTLVFDNLIQIKEQLDKEWKTKAVNTWLKRYFQNVLS